jgi:hypothetical protein
MMRSSFLSALLLAAGLCCGGCAEVLTRAEPFREVSCVQRAGISLKDAVAAAEKLGGRAIDSHLHQSHELGCVANRPAIYEVTLLSGRKLSFVSVNTRSGAIESRRDTVTIWERARQLLGTIFESDPEEKAQIALAINLSLGEAITIAESDGGKALKAHVDRRGMKRGYTVKLVERSKLRIAWVEDG